MWTNGKFQTSKLQIWISNTTNIHNVTNKKNPLLQGKRKNKLEKHERKMPMMTYSKNIPLIGIKKNDQ